MRRDPEPALEASRARDLPIDVERVGEGDPMVLLHGYGASRFSWREWVPELAGRHALHLVDLRGFGAAPKLRGIGYGPIGMARDVVAHVLALDLRRITLVGHSLGGGVALLAAMRLEDAGELDRVERIVSVAGTAYPQHLSRYVGLLRRRWAGWVAPLVRPEWIVRGVLERIVYDPAGVTPEQVRGYVAPLRSRAARRVLVECARDLFPEGLDGLIARYRKLDVPTLVLCGRQDPVVPLEAGERLSRELPSARLVVLERCGHLPAEERPADSLEAVLHHVGGR